MSCLEITLSDSFVIMVIKYSHGVSPTASVYQSNAVLRQVVLPSPWTRSGMDLTAQIARKDSVNFFI